jgi:Tfp pilus assembly major pilin PilA
MKQMNEESVIPKKPKMTWPEVLAVITVLLILASLIVPTFARTCAKGNITKGISNARQVIISLKIYAADHDGKYPDAFLKDPRSSNEVFRVLFQENHVDNELIFGCPISPFVPDGNIGDDEDRSKALEAGENHWAMTAGLNDRASGSIPLVYENPVITTWSPKWNPDAKGTNTRGRAWSTGIIVGMNDSSVSIQPLEAKTGTAVPLRDLGEGQNLFSQHDDSDSSDRWRILDVEVKP